MGQQYLVSEEALKAFEGIIRMLNSQDLSDVDRANKVVPEFLKAIRLSPFDEDALEKFLVHERGEILDEAIEEITKFEKECHEDWVKTDHGNPESIRFYKNCEKAAVFLKARINGLKKR